MYNFVISAAAFYGWCATWDHFRLWSYQWKLFQDQFGTAPWKSISVMLNQRKIVYFFSKINRGELKGLHGWSIILDAAKIFQSQVHSLRENSISYMESVNNSFEIYLISNLSALARSSSFHGVPQLKFTQWIKQLKAKPSFLSYFPENWLK